MTSEAKAVERLLRAILVPEAALDTPSAGAFLDAAPEPGGAAFDAALEHAARADRLGYAFAAGYVAAGRALASLAGAGLPPGARVSLAASEEGGAHPRAIQTTLDDHSVSGTKLWATLALEATHLLVIARAGEQGGRPLLVALLLPVERAGIEAEEMPAPPFCPEIRHAKLSLRAVRVEAHERLPVDGFADVLRPFRTIEDLCVMSAAVAWLGATAQRLGMPRELGARAAALVLSLRQLAALPPSSQAAHVALGGAIELVTALVADAQAAWPAEPAEQRARFERDKGLLQIASRVRRERLDKAWGALKPA